MLSNLDVVLSFAAVMLGVSMMITVLTQAVSAALNLRGQRLLSGLCDLLKVAGLDQTKQKAVAEYALKHPLLADGVVVARLAPAIRKDELFRLLELAEGEHRAQLTAAELEKVKQTVADWFDSTMDRVSHRFAGIMRGVTIGCSFVVAFAVHLDSFQLLKNLSTNPELRQSLVGAAGALEKRAKALGIPDSNGSVTAPADSAAPAPAAAASAVLGGQGDTKALAEAADGIRRDLETAQFQLIPTPYPGLSYADHFWGIVATAVLLSLGAPFWFNVLSSVSSLRPLLAGKVEDEKDK